MTVQSNRFKFKRRTLGVALALMLPFAGAAQAQSTMKLASATINDVQHEWQKEFQKEMEARVGEAVTVEIYPASQLGAIPRMSEGVLLGTIEAFTTPTSFVTNVDPRFQAFDVPGMFKDADEVKAVIHDAEFREYMETLFLNKGVRIIGAIFNSPTQMLSSEPVTTLDGFKGLKVRTFASPLQMEPMKAIGSNPTPLALSEVTPQLQAGGIDGMLAGMPILSAFKFYDTAKHVTEFNMNQIVSVTLVNEAWFQTQPAEVQTAIIEAGRAAEVTVFPWGVANLERARNVWLENGGEIHVLSDEQQVEIQTVFAEVAEGIVSGEPEVAKVRDRIMSKLEKKRAE